MLITAIAESQSVEGGIVIMNPDELNAEDWRILVVEMEGTQKTAKLVSFEARASYLDLGSGTSRSLSASESIEWGAAAT